MLKIFSNVQFVTYDRIQDKSQISRCSPSAFCEDGSRKHTMNDIALASKKGRRTLYTYFKSKDEIYLAVVESELDILSDMMKRVAEKNISPDEKLLEMIYTRLDAVKEVVYRNGTLRAYSSVIYGGWKKFARSLMQRKSSSLKPFFWKDRQKEFSILMMWR